MRKDYLGGILTLLLVNPAYASFDCHQTPTCGELGYSQSTSDCAGLKYLICPFDTSKVFCGGSGCASGKVYADGACQTAYASCAAAHSVAEEDVDNTDCDLRSGDTSIYLTNGTQVDCWAQSCDKGCADGYLYAQDSCIKVATSCAAAGMVAWGDVENDRCYSDQPDSYVIPSMTASPIKCWLSSCGEPYDPPSSGTTTPTQPSGCYSNCYDENLMRNNPMFAENSKNLHLLSDDNNLKLLSLASINQEDCYNKYVKALNSAVDDDFEVYKV